MAAADFWSSTTERWEQRRHDVERPVLDPAELYFDATEMLGRIKRFSTVNLLGTTGSASSAIKFDTRVAPDLHIHDRGQEPAAALLKFIREFPGRIMFAADTTGRREVLTETLRAFASAPHGLIRGAEFQATTERLGLSVLPVEEGFVAGTEFAILTESQLFGGRVRLKTTRKRSERDPESIIRSLSDLEPGDPVVHEDHGVGRYRGLQITGN